jgi:hypothetical protein
MSYTYYRVNNEMLCADWVPELALNVLLVPLHIRLHSSTRDLAIADCKMAAVATAISGSIQACA